jgi:carbon-monoxide dehydrogenase large subunit
VIDPFKAMDAGCACAARGPRRQDHGAHGPRKHHNHIFEWTVGDKD